jgi:hypothetical protein
METGSKKAARAASEDRPGPHVPPPAGTGRGRRATAAAAPRNTTVRTIERMRTAGTVVILGESLR